MQAHPALGLPPATTAPADAGLDPWEQLAQRAWRHFHAGQVESALALQMQALHAARRLLAGPLLAARPDDCLAAWVVSHHNLAELLALRHQPALAIEYLCEAHQGLLDLAGAQGGTPGIRHAAWRHLRETHAALLRWQHAQGPQPQVEAALQATARALDGSGTAMQAPAPGAGQPH